MADVVLMHTDDDVVVALRDLAAGGQVGGVKGPCRVVQLLQALGAGQAGQPAQHKSGSSGQGGRHQPAGGGGAHAVSLWHSAGQFSNAARPGPHGQTRR